MADETNVIKTIGDEIGRIFRHMLPGIGILFAAKTAHPSWFCSVHYDGGQLIVLGAIAVVVGNAWYVFHRYSFHQVIDSFCYFFSKEGVTVEDVKGGRLGYLKWLPQHIARALHFGEDDKKLRNHIELRSAQVIFLFITCEVAIAFCIHPQDCTFWHRHPCWILGIAIFGIVCAVVQQYISFKIDVDFAGRYGTLKEKP
jgi:hypothetical protein